MRQLSSTVVRPVVPFSYRKTGRDSMSFVQGHFNRQSHKLVFFHPLQWIKVSQLWREYLWCQCCVIHHLPICTVPKKTVTVNIFQQSSAACMEQKQKGNSNIIQVFQKNVWMPITFFFFPKTFWCSGGFPCNSVPLILHQICLYPPYGSE